MRLWGDSIPFSSSDAVPVSFLQDEDMAMGEASSFFFVP
jgi:hypothetical protein